MLLIACEALHSRLCSGTCRNNADHNVICAFTSRCTAASTETFVCQLNRCLQTPAIQVDGSSRPSQCYHHSVAYSCCYVQPTWTYADIRLSAHYSLLSQTRRHALPVTAWQYPQYHRIGSTTPFPHTFHTPSSDRGLYLPLTVQRPVLLVLMPSHMLLVASTLL